MQGSVGDALCAVVGRGNGHLGALGKEAALVCKTKMGREQVATVLLLKKKNPNKNTHKNNKQTKTNKQKQTRNTKLAGFTR